MKPPKPKSMKPRRLRAVVDSSGRTMLDEFFYTRREARDAIRCCGLNGCRVARVVITEVAK